MSDAEHAGGVKTIEERIIDILEPHYTNIGFKWGDEAKSAARSSVTYKLIESLMQDYAIEARIDERRKSDRFYTKEMQHLKAFQEAVIKERELNIDPIAFCAGCSAKLRTTNQTLKGEE